MSQSVPQVLGAYHLKGKLAVGGQSEVWFGVRTGPGGFARRCAIKVVLPPASLNATERKNFFAEARLMSLFDHPNLVAVTDLGEDTGSDILFCVLPYVSGRSLSSILRESPEGLGVPGALWITSRLLLALDFAHNLRDERGRTLNIIHRDVSPENVLIGFDGQVKLIDFGIALSSINPRSTRLNVVKGKLDYLSPEQAGGIDELTHATDIYSAGLLLYTLLTGINPLSGDPDSALARARNPAIPDLREHGDYPVVLAQLLAKMLSPAVQNRPASARLIARELLRILADLVPAYDEVEFADVAARVLQPYALAERRFLRDAIAGGTQVIETGDVQEALAEKSEPHPAPQPPPRRKTLPAHPPEEHGPTTIQIEDEPSEPEEKGLDDIFKELDEIYED